MRLIYENVVIIKNLAYSKSTLMNKMFSNFKEYDLFTPPPPYTFATKKTTTKNA